MAESFSRRRFLGISAAGAGLALLPFGAVHASESGSLATWRGLALGGMAELQIHHEDKAAAERMIRLAVAELRRLEGYFSLYQPDSLLVRLNRDGVLATPPSEFSELVQHSLQFADLTGGTFDPTVQPLWSLFERHFSQAGADPNGPAPDLIGNALSKVGYDAVRADKNRIVLQKRGAQLTFNGIAQGYITDRVVALLKNGGIDKSLVDMGEIRAIGRHPEGRPWSVSVKDPSNGKIAETLVLEDKALATSGTYGFKFDAKGKFSHIFNPSTGTSVSPYDSVTVIMPTATAADALATAFCLMDKGRIAQVLTAYGAGETHLHGASGATTLTVKA